MAMPRIAPNTTSEGWSIARYIRAHPKTRTVAAMASFAYQRGRPGTTSVYATPTSTRARTPTGGDGMENPPHPPMMATPKGRVL